jgi:hypothetical protein
VPAVSPRVLATLHCGSVLPMISQEISMCNGMPGHVSGFHASSRQGTRLNMGIPGYSSETHNH